MASAFKFIFFSYPVGNTYSFRNICAVGAKDGKRQRAEDEARRDGRMPKCNSGDGSAGEDCKDGSCQVAEILAA